MPKLLERVTVVSRCWACGVPQSRTVEERHLGEHRYWHCKPCQVTWGERGEPVRG